MASKEPTRGRRIGGPIRAAWFIVLTMMLAAAAWSISGKLTAWGMTTQLAWGLSLMFDLAGLICAEYARRAIERGSPAGLARLAIFGFVVVSGALNFSHGRQIGGLVAGCGLASISGAVELLFELHRRDVRDEQRAARGLIAERMPHIPMLGWVMYPGRSWRTLRGAVGARLDVLDPVQQPATTPVVERVPTPAPAPAPVIAPPPAPRQQYMLDSFAEQYVPVPPALQKKPAPEYSDPRCTVIRALYNDGTRPTTGDMKQALADAGLTVPSPSTLRGVLRAEIEEREPHLADLPPSIGRTA